MVNGVEGATEAPNEEIVVAAPLAAPHKKPAKTTIVRAPLSVIKRIQYSPSRVIPAHDRQSAQAAPCFSF